ncbi:MAG: hypothetical protein OXI49_01045 [Acidobacteriota bacterium]|nr:hypothetical protein [Acidobacteriota bacterium]
MLRPSRDRFRTAFFVLVGTGVSIAHIGCQAAPEEAGPTRIALEVQGLGLVDLPDGCARVEPSSHALELACELLETTETPAGPVGSIYLELGEPTESHIELAEVSAIDVIREEQRPLFEALPGGEFLGVGGTLFYGPFGAARYARGRFQAEDGATLQRIRLFMVHPMENRLVNLVYDHPPGDNADTAARVNNHLLVLLEHLRSWEDMASADGDGEAAEAPATY